MDSLHRYVLLSQNAIKVILRFLKKEAMAAKMVKKIQVKAPVVLKRKVGYSAEEKAEARAKMNRMQLDQDEERTEM